MSEDNHPKTQILSRPPASVKAQPALLKCVDTSILRDGVGARILLGGADGKNVITVGRDEQNQLSLHAQGVSLNHARVFQRNGHWMIEDLGSTNGTRVNNSQIAGKQSLNDGDTVAFGRACYKFQFITAGATTGVDIDLGAGEKTMIMRSAQRPAAAANAAKPESAPAARSTARTRAPAPKSGGGSNAILWIIVVVAFLGLVAGGAKLLDLF
jgi:predicted component of type VI protein secretion system